ncbi:hypothetical protein BJY52DRAFT_1191832 [Lactarius psammicola]|nr:hypothetical protein BJY52DRAFT_1191832 [Lactarius psammicola]
MATRPLPGAPYHTADFAFHSSPDVDLEAVDSYGPSEKELPTLETRIHLPSQRTAHLRRGPPVMLILLLLCCLAFVVSAFMSSASADLFSFPLHCVSERHAPLAHQISAGFRSEPHTEWVYETQARALDILKQKYNTSRVGCHATNVRDYMRRSYPVVESSLDWTNVSQSAIVLHWQGADRELKPVVITNDPDVLGPEEQDRSTPSNNSRDLQCEEEVIEHFEDLADVQTAVGMLTAVEALVQSGYQPSRTLVLSVMLGEAADIQKVSQYLHATYDEHEVDMGIKPPPPPKCQSGRLPKMLHSVHAFFDRLYWGVSTLYLIPGTRQCLQVDDDIPRFTRYVIHNEDEAVSRKLHASEVISWTHIILGAGQ